MFSVNTEKRSASNDYETARLKEIFPFLGAQTQSGVSVTPESALSLSSFFGGIKVLSEDIGSLPFEVIQKDRKGHRNILDSHPVYNLIHNTPSERYTAFSLHESLMAYCIIWGNGYAEIIEDSIGRPVSLELIPANEVEPFLHKRKVYYKVQGQVTPIPASRMIHMSGLSFDGLQGISTLKAARESVGSGLANQAYGASFFKNGASPDGVFEHNENYKPEQLTRLEESYKKKHTGIGNHHHTPILPKGMNYKGISIPPEDAQFLQSKRHTTVEIAQWFRINPVFLQDLERSTFNNVEQLSTNHVMYTLRPWVKRFEQEYDRKLFKARDKGIYTKANLNALLRGDTDTRMKFYKGMFEVGTLSPNDILRMENKNPFDGGDEKYIPLNKIPINKMDVWLDSKMKQADKSKPNEQKAEE